MRRAIGRFWVLLALLAPTAAEPSAAGSAPAFPELAGSWRVQAIDLVASSCPAVLTDPVRARIRSGALLCTLVVEYAGPAARVTQICPRDTTVFDARIDRRGELRAAQSAVVDDGICRWLFVNTLTAELRRDPPTVSVLYIFDFDPGCDFPDCAVEVGGRLEQIELAGADQPRPAALACHVSVQPRRRGIEEWR